MPSTDPVLIAVAQLARASRRGSDPQLATAARRDLIEAKLERHIREAIDGAPALTVQQRDRLAGLLRGSR